MMKRICLALFLISFFCSSGYAGNPGRIVTLRVEETNIYEINCYFKVENLSSYVWKYPKYGFRAFILDEKGDEYWRSPVLFGKQILNPGEISEEVPVRIKELDKKLKMDRGEFYLQIHLYIGKYEIKSIKEKFAIGKRDISVDSHNTANVADESHPQGETTNSDSSLQNKSDGKYRKETDVKEPVVSSDTEQTKIKHEYSKPVRDSEKKENYNLWSVYGFLQGTKMERVNDYLKILFTGIDEDDEMGPGRGLGGMFTHKTSDDFAIRPRFEWGVSDTDFDYVNYGGGTMEINTSYTGIGIEFLALWEVEGGGYGYIGGGPIYISADYEEELTLYGSVYKDTCEGSVVGFNFVLGRYGDFSESGSFFGEIYYRIAKIKDLTDPAGKKVFLTSDVPFEVDFSGLGILLGISFGGN